ncbi:MAG TPA: hypothetical protein VIK89_10940 [Cytophagaceae bacterium]
MIKTFTPNDVIRFVYDEVTETEKEEIKNAILSDNSLLNLYYELSATTVELEKIVKQPSEKVIDNILNFSRAFSYQQM